MNTDLLKSDPGTVYFLDSWLLENGRTGFSAALDCIPAGTVHHVLADHYPRIVGSLKAQGCRVRHDSVLTLVSSWEMES